MRMDPDGKRGGGGGRERGERGDCRSGARQRSLASLMSRGDEKDEELGGYIGKIVKAANWVDKLTCVPFCRKPLNNDPQSYDWPISTTLSSLQNPRFVLYSSKSLCFCLKYLRFCYILLSGIF